MFMLPLNATYVCTYFFTPCLYNVSSTTFIRSSFKAYGANITTNKISADNSFLSTIYTA